MRKVTLYVDDLKEGNVEDIIKKINSFSNRDQNNLGKIQVTSENFDVNKKEELFSLIKESFSILEVKINDISEEYIIEKQERNNIEKCDKVYFRNKYLEQKLNGLIKTLNWAIYKRNVGEKELGRLIKSAATLISMKYHGFDKAQFSIGDIVECCYGTNLTGEISGGHTHAIVCDINRNDMPYLIPISKELNKAYITSENYIIFHSEVDVDYKDDIFKGGTIILDKGKYLAPERIIKVIGKTRPDFLRKIWKELSKVYTLHHSKENDNKKSGLFGEELSENISVALKKIDKSKAIEENVITFLSEIGISLDEKILIQAFIASCYLREISYENLIFEVNKIYPDIKRDIITETLKENFKNWLNNYPELMKKSPDLVFVTLLKLFAKYAK